MSRAWTWRHYLPSLTGIGVAAIYVVAIRWGFRTLSLAEPPIWMIALIGQAAFWTGVLLGKWMFFGWRSK